MSSTTAHGCSRRQEHPREAPYDTSLALLQDRPRAAGNPKQLFRGLKEACQPTYSRRPAQLRQHGLARITIHVPEPHVGPKDTEVTAQPGQAPHDTPLAPRVPNQLSRSLRRPAGPPTAWGPRSNSSTAWPGLPSCRASWGGATGGEGLGCPPCQARLLLRGQPVEHGAYGPDKGCPARHLPCRPPRSIPGRGGPPRPLGPVPPAGPSAQEH